MKGGYRYTVQATRGDGETHAAKNLYSSATSEKVYIGSAVCGKVGPFVMADGQATCEKCIEVLRRE